MTPRDLETAILAERRRRSADTATGRTEVTYHARARIAPDLGSPIIADRHLDLERRERVARGFGIAPACGATYGALDDAGQYAPAALEGSAGWRIPTCDLARGHEGSHEDHVLDAPATVAWAAR